MAIKVLVVDDSSFFRNRVSDIINKSPLLEVIGTANNGQEAIDQVIKLKPDVVTMDIEMPVMDGITAVKKIMKSNPLPILMFSSLTHEGAKYTLDALEAGAADFLPKKFEDIARNKEEATILLQDRVIAISRSRSIRRTIQPRHKAEIVKPVEKQGLTALQKLNAARQAKASISTPVRASLVPQTKAQPSSSLVKRFKTSGKKYDILAIGTSTGGPVALKEVLMNIPAHFKLPIILVQHMPSTFTNAFAQRLNTECKIKVKEAEDGDILKPGCAYLAPGGMQMMIDSNKKIRICEGSEKLNYKPSVDITFGSLSKSFTSKVLGVILTGMGADGREGSRMLKNAGSTIWAQDEASCVVYGMPQAVHSAGISTESLPLNKIGGYINAELGYE